MRFPLVTATRVSSRCRASINMRVVIIITPVAPWRAKQKGRDCPEQTAAVDRVRMKENVIAACGPRPVLDGPAVFVTTSGGRESRSEEHTYELQSLMRISYSVLRLTKKIAQ